MGKILAYACSTRPNALWSAAQFNSALPKNRTECDIPLVAKDDYDALVKLILEYDALLDAGAIRPECVEEFKALIEETKASEMSAASPDYRGDESRHPISDNDQMFA